MNIELLNDIKGTPLKKGQKVYSVDNSAAYDLIKRGDAKEIEDVPKRGRKKVETKEVKEDK